MIHLALRAAREAEQDAGLSISKLDSARVGCVFGTSKGGVLSYSSAFDLAQGRTSSRTHSQSDVDPWLACQPDVASRVISAELGIHGPTLCPVAACATGLFCLIRAAELIQDGTCDVVIAGSSDAALEPAVLGSFYRMGVLPKRIENPQRACRPLDKSRCGFVIGEGAAALVLESRERALARRAPAYAEWLQGALLGSAGSLTQLGHDATPLKRLLSDVLMRAKVAPGEIDYVNLHGTGTRENDAYECGALRSVLGQASDASSSSLKGSIGHLLGAAGSVETAAVALALRDQVVPPTANLQEVDQACQLPDLPRSSRERGIAHALKISIGFGGHLAAAVLREPPEGQRRSPLREQ